MTDTYELPSPEGGKDLIVLSEIRCVYLEKSLTGDGEVEKGKLRVKICFKRLPSTGDNGTSCRHSFPEKEARRIYEDLKLLLVRLP